MSSDEKNRRQTEIDIGKKILIVDAGCTNVRAARSRTPLRHLPKKRLRAWGTRWTGSLTRRRRLKRSPPLTR